MSHGAVSANDAHNHSPLVKRRNGAYYTSEQVADVVTAWAVGNGARRVLDPSFGGCAFLRVALARLAENGIEDPATCVFGVDIDAATKRYTADLLAAGVPTTHLVWRDFFEVAPDDLGGAFDAVVGNPPYVRHHLLEDDRLAPARRAARRAGIQLSRRADLWAYFLAHALQFVRKGGRLAFLLPGSALQADYARDVLAFVARRVRHVDLVSVRAHLFADAAERTVVLLADGVGDGPARTWRHAEVADQRALAELMSALADGRGEPTSSDDAADQVAATADWKWAAAGVDEQTKALYERVVRSAGVASLGSLATIRIGIVTGANRFFVRRSAEASAFATERVRLIDVVSRGGLLMSPRWRASDQRALGAKGLEAHLLLFQERELGERTLTAITEAEGAGWHQRSHCRKRATWYVLEDTAAPHAFLPYMGAEPPRLTLNEAGAVCTNAVHRVTWRKRGIASRAVLGSWTTLWTVAAELQGRSYGGGVLKLEPTAAAALPVPLSSNRAAFEHVDRIARTLGRTAAIEAADRAVLAEGLGLSSTEIVRLRKAASALARRR